jgi:hypothetical protein
MVSSSLGLSEELMDEFPPFFSFFFFLFFISRLLVLSAARVRGVYSLVFFFYTVTII